MHECLGHGHPATAVCLSCHAALKAATALYRDDFLSGFSLKDSVNFDDWQFFQADALRQKLAGALERLVECDIGRGNLEPAIDNASDAIDTIMDDFHDAADKGDKARYSNHFSYDAVFMDTDNWERWPFEEFSK